MDLTITLGWIATTLFTACYIPQIIKTLKTQTTAGLSFWLLGISWIANVDALGYATLIHQRPLQVKYTLALIFLSATIWIYIKTHRKNQRKADSQKSRENDFIISE